MLKRVWSPRLQAYHWVEYKEESDWVKAERERARIYDGYEYNGSHSSMNKIYDAAKDYFRSCSWN